MLVRPLIIIKCSLDCNTRLNWSSIGTIISEKICFNKIDKIDRLIY